MIQLKITLTHVNIQSAGMAAGLNVASGAPVALDFSNGAPIASAVGATATAAFPVMQGTDKQDIRETNHIPVITSGGYIFETDQYDDSASWTVGADVTAKNGKWTVAAAGEPVVGRVVGVGSSSITIFYKG